MIDRVRERLRQLQYLVRRRRMESELHADMDAHRAMMGEPARFGNTRRLREEASDVWGFRVLDETVRDVQLAMRSLRRTPGYLLATSATLVLAMAVTATTTAVVNAYFVRPLPYPASDRLYHVQYAPPGPWEPSGLSGLDWASLGDVVEHVIMTRGDSLSLAAGDGTFRTSRALIVNQGFTDGLGVRAAIGRSFVGPDYDEADIVPAIVSQRVWRDRFGSDAGAIGSEFTAEMSSHTGEVRRFRLVGVLPEGFWFGSDSRDLVDVLLPLPARTTTRAYRVVLRTGVSPAVAKARLEVAVRQVARDLPANWTGVTLETARDRYLAPVRPVLAPLVVTAITVLLIACTNLAVLTLLRVHRRQKEIGVRLALGAGRGRIVRMLVAEAALLVAISTAVGLVLAGWALGLLSPTVAEQLGRPAPGGLTSLRIDRAVIALTVSAALLVTTILPMFASLTPWAERMALALHRSGRSSTDGLAARRWRAGLIAAQVAGTLAMLVGSGLLLKSLSNMIGADYGLRTTGLVRVGVDFPGRPDVDDATLVALYDQVSDRIAAVTRAPVPLFQWPQFAETPKQPVETDADGASAISIAVVPVNAAYFERLGIRTVRGRAIAATDRLGSEPVVVVSEAAARRLWPDGSAVGRRMRVADRFISGSTEMDWRTVVGIVSDVRQTFDDADTADAYVPFLQAPPARYAWIYVTTDGLTRTWETDVRSAVAAIDARAVVNIARPLEAEVARQWATPRFLALLVSGLAIATTLFAALGLYGVTAFSVQQREREVAIRSALGATRTAVVRMFVLESCAVLGAGLAIGLAGAVVMGRAIASQLHGVQPFDPLTIVAAAMLLSGVCLVAVWWPVTRAARRNPVSALAEG